MCLVAIMSNLAADRNTLAFNQARSGLKFHYSGMAERNEKKRRDMGLEKSILDPPP